MVEKEKTFADEMLELRKFLAKRRKITAISKDLGLCRKTVQDALAVQSEDQLTGSKIDVVTRAREMKDEIEKALGK